MVWGGFVTLSTGVSMALFGLSVLTITFVTTTLAGAFLLVLWLGSSNTAPFSALGPSRTSEPSKPSDSIETRKEVASVIARVSGTHRITPAEQTPVAIEPGSRWIDAFGPPETGQLPIQRYLQDSGATTWQTTGDTDSAPLPQWSHSRA